LEVTCENAGVAVEIRGLPEQPIQRITLENLRLTAVKGISCRDVADLTVCNVRGKIEEEPLFGCSNVDKLGVTDLNLERFKRRSKPQWSLLR
jgi:DNA sulfur modification protein DndE